MPQGFDPQAAHHDAVKLLHAAGRCLTSITRARLAGDDDGAMRVLNTMTPAEMQLAVWCASGLVGAALERPAGADPNGFFDAINAGVDLSETGSSDLGV